MGVGGGGWVCGVWWGCVGVWWGVVGLWGVCGLVLLLGCGGGVGGVGGGGLVGVWVGGCVRGVCVWWVCVGLGGLWVGWCWLVLVVCGVVRFVFGGGLGV